MRTALVTPPASSAPGGGGIIKKLATTLTSSRIETRPNWAEVSLSALRHNFRVLQDHVGKEVTICAVVKCNAYGHGVEECAPALQQAGATWFGVTSTDEGIVLRESEITARILSCAACIPVKKMRHCVIRSHQRCFALSKRRR